MPGAQSAPSQICRDYRPCHAALLNWQVIKVMGPQPELHQSPELGKRDGNLKIGLCRHLAWPSKPAQIRARFCASRGGRARRIMQTSPIFLVCITHVPPEGVWVDSTHPSRTKEGGLHAKTGLHSYHYSYQPLLPNCHMRGPPMHHAHCLAKFVHARHHLPGRPTSARSLGSETTTSPPMELHPALPE